jgi:four helix bundle protein
MLIKNAKDLRVYKLAFEASAKIHKISLTFPKYEQIEMARQIRNASKSVCSNLAEGFAKQSYSKPEFKRFLSIAIGSAKEVQVWLDYCKEFNYIETKIYEELYREYEIIFSMLLKLRMNSKAT